MARRMGRLSGRCPGGRMIRAAPAHRGASMSGSLTDLAALAAAVPDGSLLALPPDNSLPPNALARALVRRGARGLRLLGVPVSGYAADLLIGAGCVAEVESSAVSLGEAGPAPRFRAALRAGRLTMRDATCPAIHTMLQ